MNKYEESVIKGGIEAKKNDLLRAAFNKTVKNGKKNEEFINAFLDKTLNIALEDPNSDVGKMLAKQILGQDNLFVEMDKDSNLRLTTDADFLCFRINRTIYGKQQQVFNDPNHNIMAICSRRVGKTELAARLLLADAVQGTAVKKHHAIFFSLKFENAIRQCYPLVIELCDQFGIKRTKESKTEGEIELANGSNILFKGNSNNAEADKNLGYKFSCAIIDECQNQKNLQYLIDTVISPAQTDYLDCRKLILLGTPPRVPHTYCEKLWNDKNGWGKYNWNMWDNPFVNPNGDDVDKYVDNLCITKGVTRDAAFIRREMYGEWVYDKEAQVIKNPLIYNGNVIEQIKNGNFRADYVYGGIDFGFADYNAVVTVAWDKTKKMGYVIDCYKWNKSTVTEIVEKVKTALDTAQNVLIKSGSDIKNVMFYADNSDKSIVFEMRQNYNIPVQCAYKHNKMEALALLAELMATKIYTPKDSPLADEYEQVVYKRDEETDAILAELDENTYHGDAIMALLYLSRALVHFENPKSEVDYKGEAEALAYVPDDEIDFTDDDDITNKSVG